MPENDNPAQPVGRERPISTTEEVLRLLGTQPHTPDDDALSNPELEQLLSSLSKGLEEGLPDSALGVEAPGPLTLEELAGVVALPLSPGEGQAAPGGRERVRTCAKCGYSNPLPACFCGMCGQGLAAGSDAPHVPKNGAKPPIATEPPKLVQLGGRTTVNEWFKAVLLGGLVLALVLVGYQQQLWRLPPLGTGIASSLTPAAPVPQATPPAQPNLAADPAPASVERPLPAVRPPSTAKPRGPALPQLPVEASPSKAAPTTDPFVAPAPSVVNREAPMRAPVIAVPVAPAELPAIIPPPSTSPVLQGALAPAPAHESTSPPVTRVSQVTPGELMFSVNPQYPPAARSARVQGAVVMHAIIGTDGSVQQLRLLSGNPLLVHAAMQAVRMWRYRPFLLDGKPVEGETDITVNFKGE